MDECTIDTDLERALFAASICALLNGHLATVVDMQRVGIVVFLRKQAGQYAGR